MGKNSDVTGKNSNNDFFGAAPQGGRGNLSFYKYYLSFYKLKFSETFWRKTFFWQKTKNVFLGQKSQGTVQATSRAKQVLQG